MDIGMAERYHVIGYGRFGRIARKNLLGKGTVVCVDRERKTGEMEAGDFVLEDGISYVLDLLGQRGAERDWIIPCVPFHLAFEVLSRLTGRKRGVVPDIDVIPAEYRGEREDAYISYADFKCPLRCDGPVNGICPVSGKDIAPGLVERLAETGAVIESVRLGPGTGGYRLVELQRALRLSRESRGPFVVATASWCHAVLSVME